MRFNGYKHPDNFDITNRPSNASLAVGFIVWCILVSIPGSLLAGMIYYFLNPSESNTQGLLIAGLIGSIVSITLYIPYHLRKGRKKRAEFISAGGDATGISTFLFGSMGGRILPDGRWEWSQETVSTN